MLGLLHIGDYADDVFIEFEVSDKIKLTYYTDLGKKDTVLYGKMKRKFFEIYFVKDQFIIPLIYSSCYLDRVRIGGSKKDGLTIEKTAGSKGNFLFFGAGGIPTRNYTFAHVAEKEKLNPTVNDGKWGYIDPLGNSIITARYEFASRFERGVARVKANGKWILINSDGEKVTERDYDWISPIDTLITPVFIVRNSEKMGVLDINGNEIIPVECDELEGTLSYGYSIFRIGDKKGIATREGVIYPAIFSDINTSILWMANGEHPYGVIAKVKKDGKTYLIDGEGWGYIEKHRPSWKNQPIDWKNKIKIY